MNVDLRAAVERAVSDGAIIAGILLVWVAFAGFGVWLTYVASMRGTLVYMLGDTLAKVFVATGVANVALYVIARGVSLGLREESYP